jgi:hypothetical protein
MPAYGNFILDKGYDAESAIGKFTAVKGGDTAEGVTQCDAQGEDGLGIAQFEVTEDEIEKGKGCSTRLMGISEWKLGAAVSKDELVTTDATGLCEPAATGDAVWGRARQEGEEDDVIAVELFQSKYIHA